MLNKNPDPHTQYKIARNIELFVKKSLNDIDIKPSDIISIAERVKKNFKL
jgi:hypothetical protein